jgi:hypothetical protein
MATTTNQLCRAGQDIHTRVAGIVVHADGEPTALYRHCLKCEDCSPALDERQINRNILVGLDSFLAR